MMEKVAYVERTVYVEVKVGIDVYLEPWDDDDGCGPPSRTGNSMTGYRGTRWVPSGKWEIATMDKDIIAQVEEQIRDELASDPWDDATE